MDLAKLKELILIEFDSLYKTKRNDEEFLDKEFFTHSFLLDIPFSLISLDLLEATPSAFWQDKEATRKTIFLGENKSFNQSEDENEIQDLLEKHPEVELFGGFNFLNLKSRSGDWKELNDFFIFIPLLQLDFLEELKNLKIKFNIPKISLTSIQGKDLFINQLEALFPSNNSKGHEKATPLKEYFYPGKSHWCHTVDESVKLINSGRFEKIVLARKKVIALNQTPTIHNLMKCLLDSPKGSYLIYFKFSPDKFFISQSPERLFKRNGAKIEIDSIAGTRPRSEDTNKDKDFEKELFASKKELNEHRIVTESIQDNLETLCDKYEISQSERILKLEFVQHLHTQLKGTLKSETKDFTIIKTLHPTPAVGGRPWTEVKPYLKKNEGFDRGFYAAPIGIISKNKSDFAVGIRSALFNKKQVHIYGGAGIVPGSLGEEEWKETKTKMNNMEKTLVP